MQNRQKTRKIIGPRPQTGDLLRLPATPCDLGLREEFGVLAYQHPRRGKLPTLVVGWGRDGYGAHSNGLRQKRNRRFQVNVPV